MNQKQASKQAILTESKANLRYAYPMLSISCIDFFVEHRQWGYFYQVSDYIKMNGCSYETARSAMNELVDMGWYKKVKVGKKFVYSL